MLILFLICLSIPSLLFMPKLLYYVIYDNKYIWLFAAVVLILYLLDIKSIALFDDMAPVFYLLRLAFILYPFAYRSYFKATKNGISALTPYILIQFLNFILLMNLVYS